MCAVSGLGTSCSLGFDSSEGHASPGKALKGEKERVKGSSCPGRLEFQPVGIFSTDPGNKL